MRDDTRHEIFHFIPHEPNKPASIEIAVALRRQLIAVPFVHAAANADSSARDEPAPHKISANLPAQVVRVVVDQLVLETCHHEGEQWIVAKAGIFPDIREQCFDRGPRQAVDFFRKHREHCRMLPKADGMHHLSFINLTS